MLKRQYDKSALWALLKCNLCMAEAILSAPSIGRQGGTPSPDTPAALLRSLSRGNNSVEPQVRSLPGVLF